MSAANARHDCTGCSHDSTISICGARDVAGQPAGNAARTIPPTRGWRSGETSTFSARRGCTSTAGAAQQELVWWDGDLLRELHTRGSIAKWNGSEIARTEGAVHHVADIVGDWREEVVTFVNGELRIYSTSIAAIDRRVTLMQDRLYRNDVTHRSRGYPHVPMTSYFPGVMRRAQRYLR